MLTISAEGVLINVETGGLALRQDLGHLEFGTLAGNFFLHGVISQDVRPHEEVTFGTLTK